MIQLCNEKKLLLEKDTQYRRREKNAILHNQTLYSSIRHPNQCNNVRYKSLNLTKVHAVRPLNEILTHRYLRLFSSCTRLLHNPKFEQSLPHSVSDQRSVFSEREAVEGGHALAAVAEQDLVDATA